MNIIILDSKLIQNIHDIILTQSPGLPGNCRNPDSITDRIDNHRLYDEMDDIFEIASLYVSSIAQGHIFNDANKRTAFITLFVFLQLNNYSLNLNYDEDTVEMMVRIAQKLINNEEIINWIKVNSKKIVCDAGSEDVISNKQA